ANKTLDPANFKRQAPGISDNDHLDDVFTFLQFPTKQVKEIAKYVFVESFILIDSLQKNMEKLKEEEAIGDFDGNTP
ncbi:hypothetical protein LTR66_017140, partial [Elasticomyces elasticus]